MDFPINPIYEFSNLKEFTWSSNSSVDMVLCWFCSVIIFSALLKSSLNPCEPKYHKITDKAKMIFPAPVTNALVFAKTLIPTFLIIGIL